jgi:hypothetical protein
MEFVMPTRAALTILAVLMMALCAPAAAGGPAPPNIVVIMFDDLSPRIGAFGDPLARTPNLDALAKEAIRFPNTFVTAPVCAPSRAALFSGRHQQTLSAQHMRTRGAAGLPGGGRPRRSGSPSCCAARAISPSMSARPTIRSASRSRSGMRAAPWTGAPFPKTDPSSPF